MDFSGAQCAPSSAFAAGKPKRSIVSEITSAIDPMLRTKILEQINKQNLICSQFQLIISSYNNEMSQWHRQYLNVSSVECGNDEIAELRSRLHDLYYKKEQNDQQLIEAKNEVAKLKNELQISQELNQKLSKENQSNSVKLEEKEEIIVKMKEALQLLQDELFSLKTAYNALRDQRQRDDVEKEELITKIKKLKEEQVYYINLRNELENRERQERTRQKIMEAVEQKSCSTAGEKSFEMIDVCEGTGDVVCDAVPGRCAFKFVSSYGEISDVLWHPSGDYFAAGGEDRVVYLYNTSSLHKPEVKANLDGCNGAILKLDFDVDSRQVSAASTDFAIRTWSLDNFRIRATLTGHSDKVSSAKFHGEGSRIISASSDRTIRLWDVHSCINVRNFLSGSLAYDIVSNYQCSSMMISGHHDKKLRVWDPRLYEPVKSVELDGRIVSLTISSDFSCILCATRNETLSLINLSNFQILHQYSADNYRTPGNFGRCVISPKMEHCAAGSAEGQVFIWNLHSTKLEKVLLKGGHSRPVSSLSWHPTGGYLLSADKGKTFCFWN